MQDALRTSTLVVVGIPAKENPEGVNRSTGTSPEKTQEFNNKYSHNHFTLGQFHSSICWDLTDKDLSRLSPFTDN